MPHDHLIMNGGESPLASTLQTGATTAEQHLPSGSITSGFTHNDGGSAAVSGQPPVTPSTSSPDESGVASSGGIMRPRSGKSS